MYDIYSASKIITAVDAMQMVEKVIFLEDPVEKYLPEFPSCMVADNFDFGTPPIRWPSPGSPVYKATNKIMIRHLLSMQSGLTYDVCSPRILHLKEQTGNQAATRVLKAIAFVPLVFEPGTDYAYNFSLDVMAGVIEVAIGCYFGEYIVRNIFEPLNLNNVYL